MQIGVKRFRVFVLLSVLAAGVSGCAQFEGTESSRAWDPAPSLPRLYWGMLPPPPPDYERLWDGDVPAKYR